jgi:ATP-dependent DNA ligase
MNKKDFMLCQNVTEQEALSLNAERWKANYKWDGERIIALIDKGQVFLINRRGLCKNAQFQEVVNELATLPDCILDGEIISKDNNFNKLQSRAGTRDKSKLALKEKSTPIDYMIFDLLRVDGEMLLAEPLEMRVEELKALFNGKNFNNLKVCEYGEIKTMLDYAKVNNMEGIIVKDMSGCYEHRRSKLWLKLKLWKEATITIVKYTVNNAGIRAETADGIAVQIAGEQCQDVKKILDAGKDVDIYIQYLERTVENKYRFISYRGMVEKTK